MRRTSCFVLLFMLASLGGGWAKLGEKPDPYEIIDDPKQARAIFNDVVAALKKSYGFSLRLPSEVHLVHESVMDQMFANSPYKGAEVGLYTFKDGRHQIYVMKGWSRDVCSGVTAHEYTHAWQSENCPLDQELAVKEGFAMWIEMKHYDQIGAWKLAENVRETADPVYGVGVKTMLALEDKYGPKKLVELVKRVHTLAECK
ncbi:MAG: hypothetical protein AB1758_34575 [Candidatus Eremiobacterota bacterium]